MFEKLRKPKLAKNIAYYIIFGLICLVFVFIGVPVSQMSNMGGVAIMVNNKAISWSEYRRYLETLEQQQQNQSPIDEALSAKRQEQMRKQAIETLLNMELMLQSAKKMGFVVSAKEIQDKIVNLSFLKEEDRFKHSKYQAFLSANRFSAGYFENLIRKEIKTARFQNIFNYTLPLSLLEKEKKRKMSNFKLKLSYVQFSSLEIDPLELNNLESFVKEGDLDLLNQFIKNKNWEWEQSPEFNLNSVSLPGFEDQKVLFDEVLEHLPSKGVVKKIVNTRDKSFILKVDAFSRLKEKAESEEEDLKAKSATDIFSKDFFRDKMASRMLFLSFLRASREEAKIKLNPRLNSP